MSDQDFLIPKEFFEKIGIKGLATLILSDWTLPKEFAVMAWKMSDRKSPKPNGPIKLEADKIPDGAVPSKSDAWQGVLLEESKWWVDGSIDLFADDYPHEYDEGTKRADLWNLISKIQNGAMRSFGKNVKTGRREKIHPSLWHGRDGLGAIWMKKLGYPIYATGEPTHTDIEIESEKEDG